MVLTDNKCRNVKCSDCRFRDNYECCKILNNTIFKDKEGNERECPFFKAKPKN